MKDKSAFLIINVGLEEETAVFKVPTKKPCTGPSQQQLALSKPEHFFSSQVFAAIAAAVLGINEGSCQRPRSLFTGCRGNGSS